MEVITNTKLINKLGNNTNTQFDDVIQLCREVFLKKTLDYGTAWRVLRISSITDQIFIKAQRIKTIEEKGIKKINEGIEEEFKGIVNYGVIGLIQLGLENKTTNMDLSVEEISPLFDTTVSQVKQLMIAKNHDYGEAWRDMRISSFTDLILMRIHRIKQIEDNSRKTLMSENIDSHFSDIINYGVFALIKLDEKK